MLKFSAGAITALVEEEGISCDGIVLQFAKGKMSTYSSTLSDHHSSALTLSKLVLSQRRGLQSDEKPYSIQQVRRIVGDTCVPKQGVVRRQS